MTLLLLSLASLSMGCGEDDGALLIVDVRTDFVLGPELHTLELYSLKGPEVVAIRTEPREGDPLAGVRVAELEGLAPGLYHLAAVAWDPRGASLARTEIITEVEGTTSVRFLLTRDCAGVRCPETDPVRSACLGGVCEDPRCVGGDDTRCVGERECEVPDDCAAVSLACGVFLCLEGWCVVDASGAECGDDTYCAPERGCVGTMPVADAGLPADGPRTGGVTDAACRDGMQNGDETGVDCGGGCSPCADGICPAQTAVPQAECLALATLHRTTEGPSWRLHPSWATPTSPCTWEGVTCVDGHVVALDLNDAGLSGSLPPELGNLIHLTSLDLSFNALRGEIPTQLGELRSLEILRLDYNALEGGIPAALGRLTALRELDLTANALNGSIAAEIGGLSALTTLLVGGNALRGPLPPSLGELGSLTTLALWNNDLSGEIPPELGNLGRVEILRLSGNSLTGPIPASLGNLASVTELRLSGNLLSGEIPVALLETRDTLLTLDLRGNGCLTSMNAELTTWLDAMDAEWSLPNGAISCP